MPEDPNINNPITPPETPPGADPTPPEGNQGFDTSTIKDDEFSKIFDDPRTFTHPRFKELAAAKKRADALEAEKKAAEDKKLEENNEWKTLAEKREAELNETKTQAQQIRIDSAIEREAHKLGVVDSEAVLKLLDRSTVQIDDTGSIVGVTEALTKLLTDKPYLKGEGITPSMGNPSNPGNPNNNVKTFKLSELQDPAFYQKNEKEIREAIKAGKIVDDKQ